MTATATLNLATPAEVLRLIAGAQVREIRTRHAAGETLASLGRAFGVAYQSIREVVRRTTWRHVP